MCIRDRAITNDDLAKIEAEMKKIIKEDIELERFELPVAEALELMKGCLLYTSRCG